MNFTIQNKINRKLKQVKRDNVEFIAGTVSPADSCLERMSLECPYKAVEYFVGKNPDLELTFQIKWMGSRATMYLFKESVELSYLTTRNGFRINYGSDKIKDSKKLFRDYWKKVFGNQVKAYLSDVESIIIDGELMPWTAIGNGLVQREFQGYAIAVDNEIKFLNDMRFDWCQSDFEDSSNKAEWDDMDDVEKKKSPYHETNKLYNEFFKDYSTFDDQDKLDEFKEQLGYHASHELPYFAAFDILRVVHTDGTTLVDTGWMADTSIKHTVAQSMWPTIAKDRIATINGIELYGHDVSYTNIGTFLSKKWKASTKNLGATLYQTIKELGYVGVEGLMIKPVHAHETDAVHCMKLRTPEYLRLIYGHDYDADEDVFTELIKKKRTGKKRKLSHNEYEIGIKMLKLDKNSDTYEADHEKLVKEILFQIEEESDLDIRL